MQERMQQELASKTPGNAEAYSTRLEASRRRAAEDAQKEAAKADEEAAEAAKGKSSKLPDPELAAKPQRGAHTGYAPSAEAGWPEGTPADDPRLQADAMAVQRTVDTNRRMGVWEGATQATPKANSPEAALAQLAQASQGLATGRAGAPEGGTSAALSALVAAAQNAQGAGAQRADTSRDSEFLRQTAAQRNQDQSPLQARPGIGRYGLVEGTPIEVAMMTGINSDHGGQCRAQIARDVYDSLTQTQVLIPAGTRALCTYNSGIAQGDARLFMAFTRLIFPSTASVQLGAMQGADLQGAVGIGAEVDNHFWSIFGSSFLIAMVARAAESSSSSGVTVNLSGAAAGAAAASALSDASRKALERNINIRPTLRVGFGSTWCS
jgi:type IV secretion system protein VirB10